MPNVRLREKVTGARNRATYVLLDGADTLLGRREPLIPPRRLILVGGDISNYRSVGETWVQTFIEVAGLQPHERVLDAGCGIGRMAAPLTRYLRSGSYEGFDIVRSGITWCRRNITTRHPNFRFTHADLHNRMYNRRGRIRASEFRFPYQDGEFDFVFLTSVFTHMRAIEIEHYVREIARVLRPDGRCLATFFVLSPGSLARMEEGRAQHDRRFRHAVDGEPSLTTTPEQPEIALAYPEPWVRECFADAGLTVEGLHEGGWSGAADARHGQDIVLARARSR
jgi:SAM-dependent methyltransferase